MSLNTHIEYKPETSSLISRKEEFPARHQHKRVENNFQRGIRDHAYKGAIVIFK